MKTFASNVLFLLFFSAAALGVQDLCRKQTQGFSLAKARSSYGVKGDLNLSGQEIQEVRSILSKPMRFMDKGHQCYVFASEDGKHVLKLLKWKAIEAPIWTQYLPASWTASLKKTKEEKKEHDFRSYQIAFEELKEETGLIYLHLHKTEGLDTNLCLYDPIGIRHVIAADQIEFILQKKAEPFLPYFEAHKHNLDQMRDFFSSFVKMVDKRIEKKISDSDISLEYNTGICEGKPILFDIGNLSRIQTTSCSYQESIEKETALSLNWLTKSNPPLALVFKGLLEQQISHQKDAP